MKNVIKRSDLELNIKDGWYCEVKKTNPPGGNNANEGEEIYIAQKDMQFMLEELFQKLNAFKKTVSMNL